MTRRHWAACFAMAVLIVAGYLLLTAVTGLRAAVKDIKTEQGNSREAILDNRALTCRSLIALRQPIVEGGLCNNPNVLRRINMNTIIPIGSTMDHARTQRILCSIASHPECAKVPEEE